MFFCESSPFFYLSVVTMVISFVPLYALDPDIDKLIKSSKSSSFNPSGFEFEGLTRLKLAIRPENLFSKALFVVVLDTIK